MGGSYYCFLAQFLSTKKDCKTSATDILMSPKHIKENLSQKAWIISSKDLLLKKSSSAIDFGSKSKSFMTMSLPPQDEPLTNRPMMSQVNLHRRLIEIENQMSNLDGSSFASDAITSSEQNHFSCEICSGPYDTQYCMKNPKQAFVEYASSHIDEAGGKWYTFKPEQNNLGDTYNPSWKSHPNLRWRQPQNSQNNFSNPPNRFQLNDSITNRSFNNNPQNFNNQSNLEGLVSNFMAYQDARLSKFEADFKQQQSEMTNKIDTETSLMSDFRIVEDISSIIDPRLSQVVLGKPFVEISSTTHDPPEGVVRFTNRTNEVAYKMSHKIEQYNSLSDLEKEHTKLVYLRNEEDKRRRVENMMSKILGFYKECLELGPEHMTGMEDEGEVT
ncbi:hypothetical protein Tco_0621711 [Tanacetum coccineum]